ncbi:MAG: ABC transporter ATP-binding protein/permease [Clostridiales bacterium]|jgi:ATP-binding cassette subfamily B protein|nr:ABC transporter ATP-binding protein/permease [Clostridiales bacterium]
MGSAMKNNGSALVILYRVFVQVIKISPLSGFLSLIYYIIDGLFPAYITSISVLLFEAVAQYIEGSADISSAGWFGILLLIGYGAKQIFQFISSITINAGVYEKVSSNSSGYLSGKCAELPLIEYENASTMDRKNRAARCVRREIISQLYMNNVTIVMSAVGVISIIIILSSYSLLFIPIGLLSVIPYFVARIIRGKEFYKLKKRQIKKERKRDYLWSLFTDKQSIKEMRVMGFGDYISQKWQAARNEVNEETWKLVKKDSLSLSICDLFRIFGYALCILLSFALVIHKEISVGVFGACIAAFASVQGQTKSFLIDLGNIPEKVNYARDYFQFIDRREADCSFGTKTESIRKIDLKNILFKYPNTQSHAIKNLNLTINAGEKIALIGENGSGKTTLTKLLLGVYHPASGEILVNDDTMSQYDREHFLRSWSIISQQFAQYHMTLRENVSMSDIGSMSDDNAVKRALEEADFTLDESTMNLDTILGTEFGGVELSGGQWQKLAIARGVFRNCELIVMDEPTSAIDPISETEVLRRFLKIAEDKTAIIVSHRTGLCTLVDKIAVMKDGQIVEFGTHDNLLEEDGEYARLFNAQRQWYI